MLPLQRGKIQQADTLMARCPSLLTQCCINNNKNWKRVLLSKRGLSSSSSSSVLSAGETFHHPSSWLWFQLSGRSLKEGLNDKILLNTVLAAPWQRRTNLSKEAPPVRGHGVYMFTDLFHVSNFMFRCSGWVFDTLCSWLLCWLTVHCYWPRYQTVTQYWPKE